MTMLPLALMAKIALAASLQSGPISLEDALRIAEQNAYSLRLSDTVVEKARQRAREVKGNLGPKVNLDASYTRYDKVPSGGFGGAEIDSKDGRLSLTMPIDVAGVTGKAVRAAEKNIQAAQASRDAARNDLRQVVKKAFFAVLQAEEAIKVVEESLLRSKERLKNAQAELAAGSRAKVDVIRLETQVSQAEADLITARNNAELARSALNNALSRAIETPVELKPQPLWRPVDQDEESLFAIAKENRPDLRSLRLQNEVLSFVRLSEERGGVPSLNFNAAHTRSFGGSSTPLTSGTLALSIPIWDSGITRARVKAARQDEEAIKLTLEQAMLGVSLEIRQALANLRNSDARVKAAEHQVELAAETYRLTTIKFDAGEGIPLEVADASTQLTQAKTLLVNARYDYLRAIADLERAVGRDLTPGGSR